MATVFAALGRVAMSLLLALVASLALLRFLPRLPFGQRLILQTELPAETGYASAPTTDRHWLRITGTAVSALRPAGIAHLDGERVDVVSDGEFIEAGARIEVVRVDGNRIVVRRAHEREEQR
jgi:membrane-bound serine protease (ClpP class)